jgi:hypothetical protein
MALDIVFGRVSMTMGSVSDQADRLFPRALLRANVVSIMLHMSMKLIHCVLSLIN